MNMRFKLVLLTAILTGTGITTFQLIWLYKTWTITANNFYTTASSLLQKSVDDYHNKEIRMMLDQGMSGTSTPSDSPAMHPLHEVMASWEHPDVVEEVLANFAGEAKKPPFKLNEIKGLYQRELLLRKMDTPAKLARDTFVNASAPYIASAILNSNKGKTRITATFSNTTLYLIRQNTWPIGISF